MHGLFVHMFLVAIGLTVAAFFIYIKGVIINAINKLKKYKKIFW